MTRASAQKRAEALALLRGRIRALLPARFRRGDVLAACAAAALYATAPANFLEGAPAVANLFYGSILTPAAEEALFRGWLWGELQAALRGIGANGYRVPLRGDDLIFAASLFRRIVKMERGGVFTSSAIRLYLKDAFEAYSLVEKEARGETAVIPQVIRYLTEHFREPLRLDDLAARFFISKSYLNRHFKAYTNATVYAYLMALRITHARRMLRAGATAAEAGRECGFSDYSTFYKAFKAQTGITPQEFKARV